MNLTSKIWNFLSFLLTPLLCHYACIHSLFMLKYTKRQQLFTWIIKYFKHTFCAFQQLGFIHIYTSIKVQTFVPYTCLNIRESLAWISNNKYISKQWHKKYLLTCAVIWCFSFFLCAVLLSLVSTIYTVIHSCNPRWAPIFISNSRFVLIMRNIFFCLCAYTWSDLYTHLQHDTAPHLRIKYFFELLFELVWRVNLLLHRIAYTNHQISRDATNISSGECLVIDWHINLSNFFFDKVVSTFYIFFQFCIICRKYSFKRGWNFLVPAVWLCLCI